MRSPINRRLYVGRLLDADNELDAITRRQAMRVLDRAEPDVVPRDWRLTVAAICIGVSVVGLVLSAILAITWP